MTDLQKFIATCEAQTEAIEQYLEVLIDLKEKIVCAQPVENYIEELTACLIRLCAGTKTPTWVVDAVCALLVKAREEGLK